jgi:hypothetical protein
MTREDCYQCDGDGYGPNYAGNCSRCGGGGKEIPRPEDLREQIEQLQREKRIIELSVPLEDELSQRIDEMLKYLSMEDGFTLTGIARLLIECQRRMASDWVEIGNLRRELKAVHAAPAVVETPSERTTPRGLRDYVQHLKDCALSKGRHFYGVWLCEGESCTCGLQALLDASPAVIETLKSYCVSCGHYRVLTHRWIGEEDCWKWLCQPCLDDLVECE